MQKCYATIVENKLFLMGENSVNVKQLNKECAVKFSVLCFIRCLWRPSSKNDIFGSIFFSRQALY